MKNVFKHAWTYANVYVLAFSFLNMHMHGHGYVLTLSFLTHAHACSYSNFFLFWTYKSWRGFLSQPKTISNPQQGTCTGNFFLFWTYKSWRGFFVTAQNNILPTTGHVYRQHRKGMELYKLGYAGLDPWIMLVAVFMILEIKTHANYTLRDADPVRVKQMREDMAKR